MVKLSYLQHFIGSWRLNATFEDAQNVVNLIYYLARNEATKPSINVFAECHRKEIHSEKFTK